MADQDQDPPLLPLAEAAARSGRHPEALRSLAKRGKIRSVRGNDGRLLVELPVGQDPAMAGSMTGDRPDLAKQVADLEQVVAELREDLAETRLAMAKLEAERDAAKAIAAAEMEAAKAAAEVEARLLREALEREQGRAEERTAALRELVEELRADLAAARKSWWRRLIGS